MTLTDSVLINSPIVVLVNEVSANASRIIISGALQDNNRAVLVGQKTFCKGLLQSVEITLDQQTRSPLWSPASKRIQRKSKVLIYILAKKSLTMPNITLGIHQIIT